MPESPLHIATETRCRKCGGVVRLGMVRCRECGELVTGSAVESVPPESGAVQALAGLEPIAGQRIHADEAVQLESVRIGALPHVADASSHDPRDHGSHSVALAAEMIGRSGESAQPGAAAVRANTQRTTIPVPAVSTASFPWRKLLAWLSAAVVAVVAVIVWIQFTPTKWPSAFTLEI